MPRNGRSAAIHALSGLVRPWPSSRVIAGPAAPTPGTTTASAPARSDAALRNPDVGAHGRQRLVNAHEVAGPVVNHRHEGPRWPTARPPTHPSAPLVEATPVRRGSISQATRSARPSALNVASARW